MKLTDTTIEIRPRNKWEAIDLGLLLAHRHFAVLLISWCLVTLPIFALLTVCFWRAPLIPFFIWDIPLLPFIIFWWLKPIFDRIPLYILSNAVFGHTPSVKAALLFWLKSLKSSKTLSDLTIHRFNLTRSFDLAVKQLEGLTGGTRKKRLNNLYLTRPHAKLLTIIFINFEAILYTLLTSLIFMLVPDNNYIEQTSRWDTGFLINLPIWIVHLTCSLYVLVLIISEPLYVACGFCLYLNSRILLDGWDIEMAFRRLSQRLTKTLPTLVGIICLLLATSYSPPSKAEPKAITQAIELPNKVTDTPSTQPPSSLEQARKASQQQIKNILAAPPFFAEQEKTYYRWTKAPSSNFFSNLAGWFFEDIFKILIWAVVIVAILVVIWQYRNLLPLPNNRAKTPLPPKQLFGLVITPESLPTDVLAEFEILWQQNNTRHALSLLYRALLSHLVHQYHIPLKSSHTEGEIVKLTQPLQLPTVTHFTGQLTNQWLQLAYGHYQISNEQKEQLTKGWQLLLESTTEGIE